MRDLPAILHGLGPEDLERAMQCVDVHDVEAGECVWANGDRVDALFIVLHGDFDVDTEQVSLVSAMPGDVLGGPELIAERAMSTIRAGQASALLRITHDDLRELQRQMHPLAGRVERAMLFTMSRWIRDIDGQVGMLAPGRPFEKRVRRAGLGDRLLKWVLGSGRPPTPLQALEVLERSQIFKGISHETMTVLAGRMKAAHFDEGSVVFVEGAPVEKLYVLVSGEVDVMISHGPERFETLGTLGSGVMFGMTSIIDHKVHSASIVARSDINLLTLSVEAWDEFVAQESPAGVALRQATLRALASVLMQAQETLVQHQAARRADAHRMATYLRR